MGPPLVVGWATANERRREKVVMMIALEGDPDDLFAIFLFGEGGYWRTREVLEG